MSASAGQPRLFVPAFLIGYQSPTLCERRTTLHGTLTDPDVDRWQSSKLNLKGKCAAKASNWLVCAAASRLLAAIFRPQKIGLIKTLTEVLYERDLQFCELCLLLDITTSTLVMSLIFYHPRLKQTNCLMCMFRLLFDCLIDIFIGNQKARCA